MIVPRRRKRDSFLPWLQLALDVTVSYALLRTVFWTRFESGWFSSTLGAPDYPVYHRSFWLIVAIVVFFLRFFGLYRSSREWTFPAEIARVCKALFSSTLMLTAVTFFFRGFSFSRTFLVSAGVILATGLSMARFGLGLLVMWVDDRRGSHRNVLLLGCDENATKLVRFYRQHPRFSTRVIGILDDTLSVGSEVDGVPVLGRMDDLPALARSHHQVHEVVLARQLPAEDLLRLLCECEKEMLTFRRIADVFGLIAAKMSVTYLGGVPILSFTDSPLGEWENRVLKRAMDVVFSAAALPLVLPLTALIALLVRLDSPGPILFVQERIGQDGRRFKLYKFRTMRIDAERESGPVWTKEDDPRRTRLGAFLRRNNLDELPQLWNVLAGDMSLVGPRPERPFFVSQFREDIPRYMARHMIRSGLTGWAQVNGLRGNTSIEERTKFDLFYIENWSLAFDLKVLFMTFFARRNAY